jgi:hypothetical protein
MVFGLPLLAANLLKAAKNASVDRLVTNSMWIALVTKHTKIAV